MNKFNETNLRAGLATFILPSMTKRERAAIKQYDDEVREGIAHRLAIEHALKAAVYHGKPLKDAKVKLRKARQAAGLTVTVRRPKVATNATSKAETKTVTVTKEKTTESKKKEREPLPRAIKVLMVVGAVAGLAIAIWGVIPLAVALNQPVYGRAVATPLAVVLAPLSVIAGGALGFFIGTLLHREKGEEEEKAPVAESESKPESKPKAKPAPKGPATRKATATPRRAQRATT